MHLIKRILLWLGFLKPEFEDIPLRFLQEAGELQSSYIPHSSIRPIQERYKAAIHYYSPSFRRYTEPAQKFFELTQDFESTVRGWNAQFIANALIEHDALFSNIDGKSLDIQQRTAILTDEDCCLVVAGAGSGKTLTIAGKVKYLVDVCGVLPSQILLVTYTKKAADEMEVRIKRKLGVPVGVETFHRLGKGILQEYTGYPKDVDKDLLARVVSEYIDNKVMIDPALRSAFILFFGCYLHVPEDDRDPDEPFQSPEFETLKGRVEGFRSGSKGIRTESRSKRTLAGEQVKSIEECMIANYLYLNGIPYMYERDYEHDTRDPFRRQYKPDFYLPELDVYYEHFGVDREENAPWLSEVDEERYKEGMSWKRELHQEKGTVLIETYSWMASEGILLDELDALLVDLKAERKPAEENEILDALRGQNDREYGELKKLFGSFITLYKSSGPEHSFDHLIGIAKNRQNLFFREREMQFLILAKAIHADYEAQLHANDAIDFADMINRAVVAVPHVTSVNSLRYIVLDEYQDTSVGRFRLIDAIRKKTGARVSCYGDDWQSIYRFAGSDIHLFTHINDYFGHTQQLKIESTYRNSQEILDVASDFIMQNQEQIRKRLKSQKSIEHPIRVFMYGQSKKDALKRAIDTLIALHGNATEILFLGRNSVDAKILTESGFFTTGNTLRLKDHPGIAVSYLNTHSSKGLEAANVILLNGSDERMGFPNQMVDDPLLSYVIRYRDKFTHAEERRLLYVAMTRTKNHFFVLAPAEKPSVFVRELVDRLGIPVDKDPQSDEETKIPCPICKRGALKLRKKEDRSFVGCSGYPECGFTLSDTTIFEKREFCPNCKGIVADFRFKDGRSVRRCSNYPICRYTEPLKQCKHPAPYRIQ